MRSAAVVFVIAGFAVVAAPARSACPDWTGVPAPAASDAYAARLAALRADELGRIAGALDARAPSVAAALRVGADCLRGADSAGQPFAAVRLHRPAVRGAPEAGSPTTALDAPVVVALAPLPAPKPAPARPPSPPPDPVPDVSATLAAAEQALQGARYEEAAEAAREALAKLGDRPAAAKERSRAAVLAATAELALGRAEEARAHFAMALAADPDLALDPMTTSPKVRAVFESVKETQP